MKCQQSTRRGISLMEIMIAMTILAILTLACISMFIRSRNLSNYTHDRQIVYKAIQQKLEEALNPNATQTAGTTVFDIYGLSFSTGKLSFNDSGTEVLNGTHHGRVIIEQTDSAGNPSGTTKVMMKVTVEVKIYYKKDSSTTGVIYINERVTSWRELS